MSKRARTSVKSMAGKSSKKKAKLAAQKKSFNKSKLAAARALANTSTLGFLGIEKKFLDTCRTDVIASSATALTGGVVSPTSGCTGCISCPAQSDSEQGRDGKRFVIDSVILKGHVYTPYSVTSATPPAASKVFVAVVLDTQTNGGTMTSETCFKSLIAQASGNAEPTKNLLSGKRFRILKSQVFDVTPQTLYLVSAGNYAVVGVQREIDWYIPFKGGLPVNLNGGDTADVANVIDNSIHVVAFSTVGNCYIGYNARVRFQG